MPRRGYQQTVSAPLAGALFLSANPHRDYLVITNAGPMPALLSFGSKVQGSAGLQILPSQDEIILTRAALGNIIGLDIYAAAFSDAAIPPQNVDSAGGHGLSGASVGAKLSLTAPLVGQTQLTGFSVAAIAGGAPTIALLVTIAGVQTTIWSGTTPVNLVPNVSPDPGTNVQVSVTTLAAGSTFDASLGALTSVFQALSQTATLTALVGEECGMPF